MNDKNAIEIFTKFSRISLSWFGAWPLQTNKILSRFLFFISITFMILSILIPQGIKLIQVKNNLDLISQIVSTVELPYVVALTKMSVLYYSKEKITILYDYMIDHWKKTRSNDEIKIMMKNGDKGKKIALLCTFLGHATMISRLVPWTFENFNCWNDSEHFKNYTLYVEAYFPYTWNYSPVFELTCFIEFVGIYLGMIAYTGTDGFFSQIVLHLSGEYLILSLKLIDIVNTFKVTKIDYEFDEKFGQIVDVHYHINSCIAILENTFNLMFLVQLIACSIQFCLQGFMLVLYVTEKNSTPMLVDVLFIIVFLMYMIGNFYVYCYLGEQLQMESFAFAQTAYDCVWYHLPPQKAKCLLLLMQSGHKPVSITAGKFCVLNLLLFRNIIKTSMGYLSFLITTRQSNKSLELLSKYARINLTKFGAWPRQKNKKLSKCLFYVCLFTLLFGVFLPQTFQALQVWKNFELLSNVLCTAELTIVIAITKMIVLFYKKKKITILFNTMFDHWNKKKSKEELKIMQESGYKGKQFSLICIILPYSTVHCRLFQWIIENLNNWNNPEYYKNYTLFVEAYFPFKWNYSPVFEFTCCLQYIAVMCATFANSGADSFFSQIIFHFIGQYQILRSRLADLIRNIENNMLEDEFNEEFKNIVYIHHHINSCIEMLESCFYLTFLVQLLACSFQFCLQAYFFVLILTEDNSNSVLPAIMFIVVYFIYQTTTFYIFCHLAEMLQMESFYFAQTAYECKWYNLPPHKSKCLLLLMQSGHKPVSITAGKFCVLNFMLFGSIIKTSMGYLSFLITMKKNNK
ncbi:uncharacterized protein LOC127283815 [Leptopilina boulardi]|uniref:uncharacterized protein LOC127283815 n=1 Tax=Leptopilina boulardi TaxID=63433 RepID=UPI0021F62EB7|nr:uncharacterized protein LOC127283815 [Leptopilina boulardi]